MNNRSPNIGYLVVGLVFIGLAGTWFLDETGVIDPDGFQWLLPAILLGAGLIGLFASLGKGLLGRRPETETESELLDDDESDYTTSTGDTK